MKSPYLKEQSKKVSMLIMQKGYTKNYIKEN